MFKEKRHKQVFHRHEESHLPFSCPDNKRIMSNKLASKMTWQAPCFMSSPLPGRQSELQHISPRNWFTIGFAGCTLKKRQIFAPFWALINQGSTVLARDHTSQQARPNVLRCLAAIPKNSQVEIPSKPSLVPHIGSQNKSSSVFFCFLLTSSPEMLQRSLTSHPCQLCLRCWLSQTLDHHFQVEKGQLGRSNKGRIRSHVTNMSSEHSSLAESAPDRSLLFYKHTATSVSLEPIRPSCRTHPRVRFRLPRSAYDENTFASRYNKGQPEVPPILRHLTPHSGEKPDLFRTPKTGSSVRRPSCLVDLHCQAKEKDYGSGLIEKLHCFSIWQTNEMGGGRFKDSGWVTNQLFVSGKWLQRYDETVHLFCFFKEESMSSDLH